MLVHINYQAALHARQGGGYIDVAARGDDKDENTETEKDKGVKYALEAKRSLALKSFMARRGSEKTRKDSSNDVSCYHDHIANIYARV